jgi:threonyl-tRNA synthetase
VRRRFNLEYIPEDGSERQRPVIVHRAILGSVERMFAILTEHYAGKWPLWLSPRQVGRQTDSRALDMKTDGRTDSLAGSQAGRRAGRLAGQPTGRRMDRHRLPPPRVQVMVVPISEASLEYAQAVRDALRGARLHADVDATDRKMQKKVREAQLAQYNYILVRVRRA